MKTSRGENKAYLFGRLRKPEGALDKLGLDDGEAMVGRREGEEGGRKEEGKEGVGFCRGR